MLSWSSANRHLSTIQRYFGEGAVKKKKEKAEPRPWEAFVPNDRDTGTGIRDEAPSGWSEDAESVWFYRVEMFSSELDGASFGEIRLRRLNNEDLDTLRSTEQGGRARISYAPPVYANWDEVQDEMWPWVVEFKQEPADFRSAKFGARLMHNSVRSALRIASDAFFFTLEPTSCQPGVSGSLAGEFGLLPRRSDLPIPDEAKYQLTQEIRSSAEMLWLGQLNFANERSTIALRRFNLAYAGRDVEDALIDLWIGLEALFAGSEPEISHKVALRIAYYLGKSPTERRSLFRLVKDSYNARSRLVHGDEVGDLKLARKTAKQTLRLALVRVLTDQAVPALAELDDISAAGEVPPTNPPAAPPAPGS